MVLTLEIAVFNVASALQAAAAGADRIELCENPFEGGTTPSYGTLKTVREKVSLPVYPIIRPRGGDFLYSEEEFEVMKKDVSLVKQSGFEGVVLGLLDTRGHVDVSRTSWLVEYAYPMEVTFHRAFDRVADPVKALEEVISCGCQRILTSGLMNYAWDGRELIKKLIRQADGRIIIMPGSGVRSNNLRQLAAETAAEEFHSSARISVPSKMVYVQERMQERMEYTHVDPSEIKKMKEILQVIQAP